MAVYWVCYAIAVGASMAYFPGKVSGRENLPADGAYIVAPVHRSYVDWVLVARISHRRRLRYMAKEELWKSKLIGRLMEACGVFPVNRSGADRDALERCRNVLVGGEPLVMFPEGTRRSGTEVKELKDGVAYLALSARVPIVPVGIGGGERAMARGSSFPHPSRVNIVIGKPVPVDHAESAAPGAEPNDPVRGRSRPSRSQIAEHSKRLQAAIQEVFDVAEQSV
jgi:1-acyl-sn-glycerol-3-phosphate acyltransferase